MNDNPIASTSDFPDDNRSPFAALSLMLFCLFVPVLCFLFWMYRRTPAVASEHGVGIDLMMNYLLITVGMLMVAGHVVLAWFVWKFNRQDRVSLRMAKSKTEWKWALVPLVLMTFVAEGGVLAIGVPVWKKFYASPPPADAITVEITAEQFAWTIRYPGKDGKFGRTNARLISDDNSIGIDRKDEASADDVIVPATLCIPVNRAVHVKLRSKDVLHSFFLLDLRVRQDVVPGMVIDSWFVPTKAGEFEILCTELCGLGHYKMRGIVRAVSQEEYEKWLTEKAAGGSSYE